MGKKGNMVPQRNDGREIIEDYKKDNKTGVNPGV